MNDAVKKFVVGGAVFFCMLLTAGCATAPAVGRASGDAKPVVAPANGAESSAAAAAGNPPSQADRQQQIMQLALAAMAASDDPAAIALSAKTARLAGLEDGKTRTSTEQDKRQSDALQNALRLAEAMTDPEKREANRSFVRLILANHCAGLINEPFCLERNRIIDYTNSHSSNAYGWMIFAGSEFMQGRNTETQVLLSRASNEADLNWHYSQAVAVGLRYARAVAQKVAGTKELADVEVAALMIAGELTMPPFQRFSQMCNPDAEGKLPEGRYQVCRKLANRMTASGKTNIEMLVGLRALERMALGEKNEEEAKLHSNRLAKLQENINALWKSKLSYPPANAKDAGEFSVFIDELIAFGERQATENMMRKFGMDADAAAAKK